MIYLANKRYTKWLYLNDLNFDAGMTIKYALRKKADR